MVWNMYAKRGFAVTAILADPEFKHLVTFLDKNGGHIGYIAPNGNTVQPTTNVIAENEHIEEAEKRSVPSRKALDPCNLPFPYSGRFPEC